MKKKSWIKRTVVILMLSIIVIITFSCTYIYSLLHSMYEDVKIVERDSEYTVPFQPDDEIIPADEYTGDDTTAETDNDTEVTDEETTAPVTTVPQETTSAPSGGTPSGGGNATYPVRYTNIYKKSPINPDIWNILLLGRDTPGSMDIAGRSDVMIIMSYNKKNNTIKLTSMMRDSLVPIEGWGWNRINTPYFFGGSGLAVNTVNDVFNLDIQNFIVINFEGIQELIDKVGGVDVNLTQAEADYYNENFNLNVTAGNVTLDGIGALYHLRNRTIFNSDFTRTQRQRDVLISLYNKIVSENDLSKTISLINYATTKVSTNLTANDLIYLATNILRGGKQPITTAGMPFEGTFQFAWYRNMSIIQIDIEANRRLIHGFIYG